MSVVDFENNRLRQKKIEVKALVALAKYGNRIQKFEALKHLQFFAYPEALAEKINNDQETFCPKCNQWDCGAGAAGGLCVYSTPEEITQWEFHHK
jgi:hypothetical protein